MVEHVVLYTNGLRKKKFCEKEEKQYIFSQ